MGLENEHFQALYSMPSLCGVEHLEPVHSSIWSFLSSADTLRSSSSLVFNSIPMMEIHTSRLISAALPLRNLFATPTCQQQLNHFWSPSCIKLVEVRIGHVLHQVWDEEQAFPAGPPDFLWGVDDTTPIQVKPWHARTTPS